MKKYLVKGALALFGGAFLFSCAEKESEYVPLAQQKLQAFEDVFKEVYGDPDPYQDWGFSSGKVKVDPSDESQVVEVIDLDGNVAVTRAVAFGGMNTLLAFNPRTRTDADGSGEDKRLNEWGDPSKNGGTAYNVPPALTEGQKLRVRLYFQTHPNLSYVDPHYKTFFVQQVYKGNPATKGSLSNEEYLRGDGKTVTGSEHMDHLTFGLKSDGTARHHVNDFNKGDWNGGVPLQVLNTGCSANDYVNSTTPVEGVTHPDQITLMVNSSTERVGYAESNASIQHNYCCALASAADIDKWAAENGNPGEAVNDSWKRSFVGLDYEAAEDPYYKDGNGNKVVAKLGDIFNDVKYAWTGTTYVKFDDAMKNKTLKQYFNLDQEVYYLQTNKNNWVGTPDNYSQQSDITKMNVPKKDLNDLGFYDNVNEQNTVLDLTKIKSKLDNHRIPVYGKGFQEWYYGIGARDYVFSDWIVTLTNAGPAPETTEDAEEDINEWTQVEKGRVFCEDLGRATREDLDYNDVVFDAIIFQNHTKYTKWKVKKVNGNEVSRTVVSGPTEATKYYANVEVVAAGGTIPVTIQSNVEGGASYQVHDQFVPKASIETMINTRDNNSSAFGSYEERQPVQLGNIQKNFKAKLSDGTEKDYNLKLFEINMPSDGNAIKEIKIISSFGEAKQVQELQSVRGEVPRKFMAVYGTTNWPSERKNISLAYPDFGEWVKGGAAPWGNVNEAYTYQGAYNPNGLKLPIVMKARNTIVTGEETALWSGSHQYGDSWNIADLKSIPLDAISEIGQFYPGDRLRFWGTGIGTDAWITVVIGDIKPYFVDSQFPNYTLDSQGNKTLLTSDQMGCVEVLLDENGAALLNSKVVDGKVTFQVQGRNFTLTRIGKVLF